MKKKNDEQNGIFYNDNVFWCDLHGITCTGCKKRQTITIKELKKKSYTNTWYGKQNFTPYENYISLKSSKNETIATQEQ